MILRAVNVLPVPVAPRSTWKFLPRGEPCGELLDGLRLIAGRLHTRWRAGTWRPSNGSRRMMGTRQSSHFTRGPSRGECW